MLWFSHNSDISKTSIINDDVLHMSAILYCKAGDILNELTDIASYCNLATEI